MTSCCGRASGPWEAREALIDSAFSAMRPVDPLDGPVQRIQPLMSGLSGQASEIDIHFPDFGWRLCERFDAERVAASCDAAPNVGLDDAWVGVPEYFNSHRQAPT